MPLSDDIRHPDYRGPNPFADEKRDRDESSRGDSEYGATEVSGEYSPSGYQAILFPRSRAVFWMGTVGLLLTLLAVLRLVVAGGEFQELLFSYATLLSLLSLPFSACGWRLGACDRHAIAAGAMRPDCPIRLAFGTYFGLVAMLIDIAILTVGFAQSFFS